MLGRGTLIEKVMSEILYEEISTYTPLYLPYNEKAMIGRGLRILVAHIEDYFRPERSRL